MRRCASVGGEPVILETFWFDADVFPGLDELVWTGGSVSDAVLERYRMEASSAEQRFSVKLLSDRDAELLRLGSASPVLHVERVLHFRAAKNAVYVEMECRSDRFSFSQRITAEGPFAS
jgi:GntR family transcriptional regulator